jgi:hypothetical protein
MLPMCEVNEEKQDDDEICGQFHNIFVDLHLAEHREHFLRRDILLCAFPKCKFALVYFSIISVSTQI